MAKKLGRLVEIGVGRESTRGTAVAAGRWLPWLEASWNPKITKVINRSARGRIEGADAAVVAEEWSEGTLTQKLRANDIGYFLYSMFGGISSAAAAGETVVYEHSLSVANTNQHQSLTLSINDDEQDYRFPNVMVTKLEITAELADFIKAKMDLIGGQGATATNSPAYTTDYEFIPQDITIKIASSEAGLSGASAIPVKALSIVFDQSVERDQVVGAITAADFINKTFSIEIEVELLSQDTTYRALWTAATDRYMSIAIKDTNVTIGNAENPELTFIFYKVQITEFDRSTEADELVAQKLKFTAMYNSTDSKMVTAVLTNTKADYTS